MPGMQLASVQEAVVGVPWCIVCISSSLLMCYLWHLHKPLWNGSSCVYSAISVPIVHKYKMFVSEYVNIAIDIIRKQASFEVHMPQIVLYCKNCVEFLGNALCCIRVCCIRM